MLHATRDLRKSLWRVSDLLGSGGTIMLGEVMRPWLSTTLIFGLLDGWWLFDDDVRHDEPTIGCEKWRAVLSESGFSDTLCIGDSPTASRAQHALILSRGPLLPAIAASRPPAAAKTWLVFADRGSALYSSAGGQLALELRERGHRVIEVTHGTDFLRRGGRFTVRVGHKEDMQSLLAHVRGQTPRLAGIVHLFSLDIITDDAEAKGAATAEDMIADARMGSIGALNLVQALAQTDGLAVESMWLVTRGAQPVAGRCLPLEVGQAPLWGLGRVAAAEYKNLRWHLVDLGLSSAEEISALADELTTPEESEDEIALHGELRYVHRLLPVTPATVHGMGRPAGTGGQPFRIELQRPGILESLLPRRLTRIAPRADEIEIEIAATGLNFKDLMHAMGMIPRDAITDESVARLLGLECAGRVSAVGSAVTDFAVGDEVVAIGSRSLATHLTTHQRFVARKPAHLSMAEAATVPIAFVTAFYSLHTLAGLRAGERVLIHSSAGGVGLAALQLAMRAGATVFATAGTPEKRALLSVLGVPHVMDSRSLAFADEIMALTHGEGVDIVLNSLTGETIDKNFAVLRPFGRYVEIGLVDIYKNRKIGMRLLRENISVFAVDLGRAFDQRLDLPRSALQPVLDHFAEGQLHPLPHRVIPVTRVVDAFRNMTQGKHIGKMVVAIDEHEGLPVEEQPRAVRIDPDASYLITGGLGGFGLAVAGRLVRRGARHIALVGRSAPSPAAKTILDDLRGQGAEVKTYAADIADRAQTRRIIDDVQATMGPLRGILHAAMVLDDASIEYLDEERMWTAMRPKAIGAWNLHLLTKHIPLDLFVLFSSVTSTIGNPGQANYVAGNAFLDMLAYRRRAQGLPGLTVNWGRIGEVGYVANSDDATQRLDRLGITTMPLADTLDALDELIASEAANVIVAQLEWKHIARALGERIPARFVDLTDAPGAADDGASADSQVHALLEADAASRPALLEAYVRDHLARAIGTSPARIDPHQSLRNLGLDSLIALELRNRINADLGLNIPIAYLMQSESIVALIGHVSERLSSESRENGTGNGRAVEPNAADAHATSSPSISLAGADAADLLQRIDELSEEEIERYLNVLQTQGQS